MPQYYASELLDANTCDLCETIDGTEYMSLADAELDYPGGGFIDCAGGGNCRGTLVAVYSEVAPHDHPGHLGPTPTQPSPPPLPASELPPFSEGPFAPAPTPDTQPKKKRSS